MNDVQQSNFTNSDVPKKSFDGTVILQIDGFLLVSDFLIKV
jgi:hypothetical protein